ISWIETKRERRNPHRRSISRRPFSFLTSESPVLTCVQIAKRLQSACTHTLDTSRSKPLNKVIGDVFRRASGRSYDSFACGKYELRVVRNRPGRRFSKLNRPALSFKRPTHRVTHRAANDATTNRI